MKSWSTKERKKDMQFWNSAFFKVCHYKNLCTSRMASVHRFITATQRINISLWNMNKANNFLSNLKHLCTERDQGRCDTVRSYSMTMWHQTVSGSLDTRCCSILLKVPTLAPPDFGLFGPSTAFIAAVACQWQ